MGEGSTVRSAVILVLLSGIVSTAVQVASLAFSSDAEDPKQISLTTLTMDHSSVHGNQREASLEAHSQNPDVAYSLFMHHSSGIAVLVLGLLILLDRLSVFPHAFARSLSGCVWVLFGVFVFIKSDPEGWPIGANGFLDSFNMPTAGEWIEHKMLSLIPMLWGVYSIWTRRGAPNAAWTYAVAGTTLLGVIGLLLHQHADHHGFDMVKLEHSIFAFTAFCVTGGVLMERWNTITWTAKQFLVPLCILILGLQLTLYVE